MKTIRFAAAAALGLALAACHARSESRDAGPAIDRDFPIGAFQKIAVAGPYEVNVKADGAPGVHARGGSAILDETEITVENGTLKIGPQKKNGINWRWGHDGKVTVEVTGAGALQGAAVAGSGGVRIDQVRSANFEGEVAGSGDLNVALLESGRVKLAIAGSGNVQAAGKASTLDLGIAGSGDADLAALEAVDADVSIAGSGNVRARATRAAKVSIVGSGDVELTGGAKCQVSKQGSGNVSCS